MKQHLTIRRLIYLLLVLVLVPLAHPMPVRALSTLPTLPISPPSPPLPVNRLLDPFTYTGLPMTRSLSSIQSMKDPIPTSGEQTMLVILVDFSDKQGSFTLQEWDEYFFGLDGFADYFYEVSHGNLRYSGDVVGMLGDVPYLSSTTIAYVHLENDISYYAAGMYGFGSTFPYNNSGVVYDALTILDEASFDFLPYIDEQSGQVENLVVIFAGSNYGYTNDRYNSLEATAFSLSQGGMPGTFITKSGVLFDNYTFCPEKFGQTEGEIAHLGVCVHEHGHALGMFDLYDRSFLTTGTGRFDLMAYGNYGVYDGSRPFHPGVFTKQQLDWVEPSLFASGKQIRVIGPAESTQDFIKIYPRGDDTSDEYFLLENRQPIGFDDEWRDAYAYLCPGLVIWHVDESIVQDYALVNRVNTTGFEPDYPSHPGVIVVEADGRYDMITPLYENESLLNFGECTDTWQTGSTWNDVSIPSARLWDGSTSRISVTYLYQWSSYLVLEIEIIEYDHQMYLPAIQR